MKSLITSALILIAALFLIIKPAIADPFSDVPQGHWSYDAVQMLEEKGLVEGYPDGFFKGDRPMTRYEMALVVARVVAKLEQVQASIPEIPDLSIYATKEELETLNKLLGEFRDELDALGVRVANIEDSLGKVTARIEDLERIKIKGDFTSIIASVGINEADGVSNGGPGSISPVTGMVSGDIDRYIGSTFMYGTFTGPPIVNGGAGFATAGGPGTSSGEVSGTMAGQTGNTGEPEFALNEGFAVSNLLKLIISAKISDKVKAGGLLLAISEMGDNTVYMNWGNTCVYNTLGPIAAGGQNNILNFQAHLGNVWFDTDGDWDIKGTFGIYRPEKVSSNLFYGVRCPIFGNHMGHDTLVIDGVDFKGRLYDTVDIEVFWSHDINWVNNGQSSTWFMQREPDAGGGPNKGNYRNFLQGIWLGYDFMEEKKFHIEGAFMRLYEDPASSPAQYLSGIDTLAFGALQRAPAQDQLMYGIKAHYNFEKLKIYGEWAQTAYSASLQDKLNRERGNLFQIGIKASILDEDLDFYGEYVRTEANFDPFGYHKTWERAYWDDHHEGWDDMTGLGWAVRPGKFRPNRHGMDLGLDYHFSSGKIYADFTYLKQVDPSYRASGNTSEDYFNFIATPYTVNNSQIYGFYGTIAGRPDITANVLGINPYNLSGNQDYFFRYNSPNQGSEFFIEVGGKYDLGEKFHIFGGWDYMKFERDYAAPTHVIDNGVDTGYVAGLNGNNGRTDTNGYLPGDANFDINNWANTDLSSHFTHIGVTCDLTEKFSLQGNLSYVKTSGVDDSGFEQDNSTIIPGVAMRYSFNKSTSIVFDYKYYSYSDDRVSANDYSANKFITRLNVKF